MSPTGTASIQPELDRRLLQYRNMSGALCLTAIAPQPRTQRRSTAYALDPAPVESRPIRALGLPDSDPGLGAAIISSSALSTCIYEVSVV